MGGSIRGNVVAGMGRQEWGGLNGGASIRGNREGRNGEAGMGRQEWGSQY